MRHIAGFLLVAALFTGCATTGPVVPTAGVLFIVNETDESICHVPIHPVTTPSQERDLLQLLGEEAIKPHSTRRFEQGNVPLLNVQSPLRLTMLSCSGLASSVEEVDFAVGAVVTLSTF